MRRVAFFALAVLLSLWSVAAWGEALPKGKAVAIVIYESSSSLSNPGGAVGSAEAVVKQILLQNGYPVVNESQLAKIRRSQAAALALDGNVDAILSLGKKYGVKIFLSGKATMHEARQNEFGLYTGTAAIAVQAYSATNGKYLFADTVTGKEVGYTSEEASQKALLAAARVMAENIVRGEGAAGTGGGVDAPLPTAQQAYVVVSNVQNFDTANQILDVCAHLPRAKSARITGFSGGVLTIEMLYQSSMKELADSLSRKGLPIAVTGVVGNTVQAQGY